MTLTVERPHATQDAPHATQGAPCAVEPGLLHVEVDPDAPFVAGHLSPREMATAAKILTYIRERGVLVTASTEEILLVISRAIPPALVERVAANAALLRAYLACPECGQRHSLCPPYGRCWPCGCGSPTRREQRRSCSGATCGARKPSTPRFDRRHDGSGMKPPFRRVPRPPGRTRARPPPPGRAIAWMPRRRLAGRPSMARRHGLGLSVTGRPTPSARGT